MRQIQKISPKRIVNRLFLRADFSEDGRKTPKIQHYKPKTQVFKLRLKKKYNRYKKNSEATEFLCVPQRSLRRMSSLPPDLDLGAIRTQVE